MDAVARLSAAGLPTLELVKREHIMALDEVASRRVAGTRAQIAGHGVRSLLHLGKRLGLGLIVTDPVVQLTADGKRLLNGGRRYIDKIDRAAEAVAAKWGNRANHVDGAVRVACPGSQFDGLVDVVARDAKAAKLVIINARGSDHALTLFERYAVHGAYVRHIYPYGLRRVARQLAAHTVTREEMWLALPAEEAVRHAGSVSMTQLKALEWVAGPTQDERQLLVDACRAAGFEPNIRWVAESRSAVRQLLWNGGGALIPATSYPAAGTPFRIVPLEEAPTLCHQLVVDPEAVPAEIAAVICDKLLLHHVERARSRNPRYASQLESTDRLTALLGASATGTGLDGEGRQGKCSIVGVRDQQVAIEVRLDLVHVLAAINHGGSLSVAARRLHVSQPTLTRRIQRVEKKLGARLILTGPEGSVLTIAGVTLLNDLALAAGEFHQSMQRR